MDVELDSQRATVHGSRDASSGRTSIGIAKQLELDRRAATQKFCIIARSDAGKTYLARKLVEGLHGIGCQVTLFDPVGNWWGLTLAANGKDPGLPFVVFGVDAVICARAIGTALRAQKGAVGKDELAGLTGYSASSGGFNNALSKL